MRLLGLPKNRIWLTMFALLFAIIFPGQYLDTTAAAKDITPRSFSKPDSPRPTDLTVKKTTTSELTNRNYQIKTWAESLDGAGKVRTRADGSFEVPLAAKVSWRLYVEVTGSDQSATRNAIVLDNFGAVFEVSAVKASKGKASLTINQGTTVNWLIGDLGLAEKVQLEMTISLKADAAGNQEFTSPSNERPYKLNPGATLKFTGVNGSIRSNVLYVYALSPEEWNNTGDLSASPIENREINAMLFSDGSEDKNSGINSNDIVFTEEFLPKTDSILSKRDKDGKLLGFNVPEDTKLEWLLILTIKNKSSETIKFHLSERFGAQLVIDREFIASSNGIPDIHQLDSNRMDWYPELASGCEATLRLKIYTGISPDGRQAYSDPTTESAPNYLNSGARLVGFNLKLPPTPIWVFSHLEVSLNANRLAWQVRKPGIYAGSPIEIAVKSNYEVTLSFHNFDNLKAASTPAGFISAFYGVGSSLAEIGDKWVKANELNRIIYKTTHSGITKWSFWPKIEVSGYNRADVYHNVGSLTFTVNEVTVFEE